ncbi:GDSL-type esterase/lipase family protein [Catenuloplanes japonicus]|uniref:GDSL-type esterase/lipase family protein n=1 Tax=Catenuloplanes japonicus TaxID=33876 RepID=UPI00052578AC|nr:GDSL-type esterase/lipase family protein [Catenuloplanes japonicus]
MELVSSLVRGALELERTPHGLLPHRLPAWARAQAGDPQLATVEAQTSGVRLALRTAATRLELDTLPTRISFTGLPSPAGGDVYDLLVDGVLTTRLIADGGDTVAIDMAAGTQTLVPGPVATLRFDGLPAREKDVEIWLPYRERTELRDLRADAPIAPIPDRGRRTWLHHGSSISHGSNASGPSATWPARAAAAGGVELINLGLGGSALLDPFTARVMRDTPADLISVKIGINVVNADLMRRRAFGPAVHGFLDTIRDGHPDVPLLVISAIHCPIHEETPGPGAFDPAALAEGRLSFRATGDPGEVAAGRLTLRVIREELSRIVAQRTDSRLSYLDGLELYGPGDAEALPLPDALHPDDATHALMAARFAERVFVPDGAFGS